MIDLGLSGAERRAFEDTLATSHHIRVHTRIHDADEKPIGSMHSPAHMVIDGAVQVDSTQDVSRSLDLSLLDPKGKLAFDPATPSQGSVFAAYFVQVHYGVYVPPLADWVDVPVFFGPITGYGHQAGVVSVEAQGKEALMLDPHFVIQGYKIDKNTRVDDGIRRAARKSGERKFNLHDLPGRVRPHDLIVRPGDETWRVITGGRDKGKSLMDFTGPAHEIFFNARGRLVSRHKRKSPVFTFGPEVYLTWPQITYDLLQFVNYVRVHGSKPKGAKHAAVGVAQLPKGHPLSAQSLARNGEPRYMAAIVDAPNLDTDYDCRQRALDILLQRAHFGVEANFDSLVVPHLEENDPVAVRTHGEGSATFPLRQFTIPLTASESMSVGENKRLLRRGLRRNIRRRERRLRLHHFGHGLAGPPGPTISGTAGQNKGGSS